MIVLNNGLPFRVEHKIHLDIFQSLFPTLSSLGSLVVDINSSSFLFQISLHSTSSNFISFIHLCDSSDEDGTPSISLCPLTSSLHMNRYVLVSPYSQYSI